MNIATLITPKRDQEASSTPALDALNVGKRKMASIEDARQE